MKTYIRVPEYSRPGIAVNERRYNPDGSRVDQNPRTRTIICVDGEGWNIPLTEGITSSNPAVAGKGWHSYVMMAAADDRGNKRTLVHDGSRREANSEQARNYGLSTAACCDFLVSLPRDALIASFVFSYDTTKITADLPLENMTELGRDDYIPQPEYNKRADFISSNFGIPLKKIHDYGLAGTTATVYDRYAIKYIPRKWLEIYDLAAGLRVERDKFMRKNGSWGYGDPHYVWNRSVTVWDVFSFFQSSFLKVLERFRCGACPECKGKTGNICANVPWTEIDLSRIESMKAQRGIFTPSEQSQILDYCIDECRYLAHVMRDLTTQIHDFGLNMRRWDGSGAVASTWLAANKTKTYLPEREHITFNDALDYSLSGLPESVALGAYYGGRFEITEIGYMGSLYSYDINSAYPHIIRSLPCLAHGRFERVSEYVPGALGVYLAGSRTAGRFAPFPFRTAVRDAQSGIDKSAIYYAHGGQRWIWSDELAAARRHYGPEAIPVYDGYVWIPGCSHKPFAGIDELYETRKEYVRQGNGIEKVIKLILNSLYGKFAQALGWNIDNEGNLKAPPYQCFIWAGIVTSGCRAMILDAINSPSADVVSIATDGILSRTPIPELPAPKEKILGQWEAGEVSEGYLFQSGVYTYIDDKGNRVYKTRGFNPKEIPAQKIIDAYRAGVMTVKANPDQSRFVSVKSGVSRTDALEYIGQWIPSEHDITLSHNRRIPVLPVDSDGEINYLGFASLSEPHEIDHDKLSAPHSPKQTWQEIMEIFEQNLDYPEA